MSDGSFSFEEPLDASIELTPPIDTVFMLLVFFIMATTFSKPVLEVALQNADGAAVREAKQEPLTISITEEGHIFNGDKEISLDDLDGFIRSRPKEEAIIFNVDKEAPFGVFVTTLDTAKKHGKEHFAITAAPPSAKTDRNK